MEEITIFNKILLNGKYFNFSKDNLPCLIFGVPHTGTSQFTVNVAVNLLRQRCKIIFFSAFEMAKENLLSQIEGEDYKKNLMIISPGSAKSFIMAVREIGLREEKIIVLKNFEQFEDDLVKMVYGRKGLILSGNADESSLKKEIARINFSAKIFFSKPKTDFGIEIPVLNKYEGYFYSKDKQGIIKLT